MTPDMADELRPKLRAVERVLDGTQSVVIETSGSTGEAKRVALPAAALRASAMATAARLGGHGRWLLALPTTHIAGYQVLVRSTLAGTAPVPVAAPFTASGFTAASRQLTGTRRYAALVPTQLRRVLADPAAAHALAEYDAVLVGGAALDETVHQDATTAAVRVVTTYGMTETCGGCVYDGHPLDDVRVEAPADGPIRIGGPVVFAGYEGRPDLTEAALVERDGVRWHLTRDIGTVDPDGTLRVLGRVDDMIVTGGYNVSPAAVEAALLARADITAVAVVGVPDDEWGQRVVAVVVPADPARPPSVALLRADLSDTLPAYALPREAVVTPEIPMLPTGKPDRAAVRRSVSSRLAS